MGMETKTYRNIIFSAILLTGCANSILAQLPSNNIVRNSSFENDKMFNGTPMRNGRGEMLQQYPQLKGWTELPVEAWWLHGENAEGASVSTTEAKSGRRSLRLDATKQKIVLYSAYDRKIKSGPVTLSAWVKTDNAQATLELQGVSGNGTKRPTVVSSKVKLPINAKWTRITTSVKFPAELQAIAVLKADSGKIWLDDVQIEAGNTASEFNICPAEFFELNFSNFDNHDLPKFISSKAKTAKLTLTNNSRVPLSGDGQIYMSSWNGAAKDLVKKINIGQEKVYGFDIPLQKLTPDSYIVYLLFKKGNKVLFHGKTYFYPKRRIGGLCSSGMMSSRGIIRFVMAPDYKPQNIFGVGNDMIFNDNYFSGYSMADAEAGKKDGISCSAVRRYNDDVIYVTAAAAVPTLATIIRSDRCRPNQRKYANPADVKFLDIYNPEARKIMEERAVFAGKNFGKDPSVAATFINGECAYYSKGKICPTEYADMDFRKWCQKQYKNLSELNSKWNTRYKSWDEVNQFFTPGKFAKNSQSNTAAEIDWKSNIRFFPKETIEKMTRNGGKAMDWLRWRTSTSLELYSKFRNTARKYDKKTLYGENLAWPTFWPQVFMPLMRELDVIMLDFQYTSGFRNALGNPMEMIEVMEMSESIEPKKPIWGVEVYVQPSFPPEYVDMQNWGLIAHGVTNNLIFAWKPYSDKKRIKKKQSWLEKGAPPMWYMIDIDGTELPQYKFYQKSIKKINQFNKKYNMLQTSRIKTDVAIYASHDTNEYFLLSTGNKPYNALWMRARNTLVYLLRMNGITADFVDDISLPDSPGRYKKLIIPPSYVISEAAAKKIASFAKQGGTVIFVGPSGLKDPWLKDYAVIGGAPWKELDWKIYNKSKKNPGRPSIKDLRHPADVRFAKNGINRTKDYFLGRTSYKIKGARPIKDSNSSIIGWQRKWGKGNFICYSIYPQCYKRYPQISEKFNSWVAQLINLAAIKRGARFLSDRFQDVEGLGKGNPVVEAVIRDKSPNEKFVFCMNQGGSGRGTLSIPVPGKNIQIENALDGRAITDFKIIKDKLTLKLDFKPWQYYVFRIINKTN